LLTKLKEKVQDLLASEAEYAEKLGLTPNLVSFLGLVFALGSSLTYWVWPEQTVLRPLAPTLLILSGFCDALDGVMARTLGMKSTFGGFLDSLLDRYGEVFVLLGIIGGGLCNPSVGILAMAGSLLVSYSRARAEEEGVRMEGVGLFERSERILLIVVASFLNLIVPEALSWSVVVLAIATHLTVMQRALHFFKESKKKKDLEPSPDQ